MTANATVRDSLFSYPALSNAAYAANLPFPHAVFENAWSERAITACKAEVTSFSDWEGEKDFYGAQKKRFCGDISKLPATVRRVIEEASTPAFLRWLEDLTGEKCLVPDPYLEGGGIHQIRAGGFLKVHADFNWNENLHLYRRLNVLVYLNADWKREWGGALELWKTDMSGMERAIFPDAGTTVVFTTDDTSFHGHPSALACPVEISRDSIALYYYSAVQPTINHSRKRHTTDYRPINGETFEMSHAQGIVRRIRKKLSALKRTFLKGG